MTYTPVDQTDYKNSVRVASTANLTLSAPGATIDGVTMVSGNRFLAKDQTTGSENGIYVWNGAATAATRARDADQANEITAGLLVYIESGTVNGDKAFRLTTDNPITIGSTALTFTELAGSGGTTTLDGLSDVDTTGVVDGALLRYEATGTTWADTTNLLLNDNGQLQITATGTNAGVAIGVDTQLYRSAANIMTMGTGDKLQSDVLATTANDYTNQVYTDRIAFFLGS